MANLSRNSLILLIGGIFIITFILHIIFVINSVYVANVSFGEANYFLRFFDAYLSTYPINSNYTYIEQWEHIIDVRNIDECNATSNENCRDLDATTRPFIKKSADIFAYSIILILIIFAAIVLLYFGRNNEMISLPTKITYLIVLLYFLISTITILAILNSKIPTLIPDNEPNIKQAKSNSLSDNLFTLPLASMIPIGIILIVLIIRAIISSKL